MPNLIQQYKENETAFIYMYCFESLSFKSRKLSHILIASTNLNPTYCQIPQAWPGV